jgi:cytochrome c oxidase cbb3-type subunit 4
MSYESLRHFADSYGLIMLGLIFLTMVGWTFRPGATRHHARAATMIFDEDQRDG